MGYPWLEDYCVSKKGAAKDLKEEWGAIRYTVGGKMFAMQGNDGAGRPIITLKLAPEEGLLLRGRYEDVTPGYYMNKVHWNSVFLDGSVPDDVLRDMVDKSYAILFGSLSKKAQNEIE
ncbi:MAG: MmcQ/YjbR family DNA-binding protein [Methanomassiliicoccaceae archaeon]|nr:MmcQ/YjbR family DNA-binding protein [Methanomassiliicoccaceae archaeon]